jgi:hypothetical protein
MAGSFGFEADKYDISVDIGERVLLPAVRQAGPETLIVADGFSCRTQIEQETGRRALHLAELIRMGQTQNASDGAAAHKEEYPEDGLYEKRSSERRKARLSALVMLAAVGAIATAVTKAAKEAA